MAAFALIFLGILLSNPVVVLLGLTLSTTAVMRSWLPWDLAIPAAVLGLLAAAVVTGLSAGFLGLDLLAHPWALAVLYVGYGGVVALTFHRSTARAGVPWWTMAPAAVAVGTGLLQAFRVDIAKSWAFYGTDLARHMSLIESVQVRGSIDYSATPYPHGFHMIAALGSVPRPPMSDSAELMGYDLRLEAALTWLALALMLWTGAALTGRAGQRLTSARHVPALAALLLGAGALVTNTFIFGFVYMGAAPGLLAVAVIWCLPLGVLAGVAQLDRLSTSAAAASVAAMLLAHLWQPLAIAPACAIAVVAATRVAELPAAVRSRAARAHTARCAAIALPSLALAAVPLSSVQRSGGVGLAATAGRFPGEPWWMLAAAGACALVLLAPNRGTWARLYLGAGLGLVTVWLLMLSGAGFAAHSWYPVKAAWFLTLVLCPLLALGAMASVRAVAIRASLLLGRIEPAAFVLRCTALAVAAAFAFGFWLPHILGNGLLTKAAWQAPDGGQKGGVSARAYDIADRFGADRGEPVVVPYYVGFSAVFDVQTTRLVSELFSFRNGQPELLSEPRDICAGITKVAGTRGAVVISKLPRRMVREDMAHHGCPGRARVVRVPGKIADLVFARRLPAKTHR